MNPSSSTGGGTNGGGSTGGNGATVGAAGGSGGSTTCLAEDCPPEPLCGEESKEGNECPLPWIHQEGAAWVDENGDRVDLRGFNLGNWLQLEFWMTSNHIKYSGGNVPDQCTLEGVLRDRFGQAEKERLMNVFYESWMTERDFENVAALNVNLLRVPFMFNVIEDEANPFQLRPDAWKHLDFAVEQAKKHGIYLIWDLHGAVGSQGHEQHSGCEGKNELWGSEEYRARTKWLWEQIADRYKDESTVAGHGLLNEPWGTDAETLAAYSYELFDAIRAKDPNHVIILPGHNTGISAYGNPSERPNTTNVALEMHFYPGFFSWRTNEDPVVVHSQWLHCDVPDSVTDWTGQDVCEWDQRMRALDTAFFIGEFQPWSGTGWAGGRLARKTYDVYNMFGWASTAWSYKVVTRGGSDGNAEEGWPWGAVVNSAESGDIADLNVSTASPEEIEAHFAQFATQKLVTNPELLEWLNYEHVIGEPMEAEFSSSFAGVSMEACADEGGGFNVSNLGPGGTMTYEVEVQTAGTHFFEARVSSEEAGGTFQFILNGDPQATITVPPTGGWQTWETTTPVPVDLPAGRVSLTLEPATGAFNLNWFRLAPQ